MVRGVREGWGLGDDDSSEAFLNRFCGVKFNYTTGGPGYNGEPFVLQGDSLQPPILRIRKKGAFTRAELTGSLYRPG